MSGNDNKEGEKDDAYDLDYYERTDRKDDENLRREVGSVKKQLNNAIKVSMLANLCLLLLGIATLALLSFVVFNQKSIANDEGDETKSSNLTFSNVTEVTEEQPNAESSEKPLWIKI